MLFRLLLIRLLPLMVLYFLKERTKIKRAVICVCALYIAGFLTATGKIIIEEHWKSILYVPISMFPHYLCYGFSLWMLIRCIWCAWSDRVWKRIYMISLFSSFAGVFAEKYWNSKILQLFFEVFK